MRFDDAGQKEAGQGERLGRRRGQGQRRVSRLSPTPPPTTSRELYAERMQSSGFHV